MNSYPLGVSQMPQTRNSLLATVFSVMSVFVLNTDMAYAATAVAVSDAQIAAMANACNGGASTPACVAAVQKLVADLAAANPGVAADTIIASIGSKVAEASNTAIANPASTTFNAAAAAAAVAALSSYAASSGFSSLASTLSNVATSVANTVNVDLGAIASGNTTPKNKPGGGGSGGGLSPN